MLKSYRKSIYAKMTSIGFIYLILLGNIWLAFALIAHDPPKWVFEAFLVGAIYTLLQFLAFLCFLVKNTLNLTK